MQSYIVGGAVRDQQLGLPVKDRDWVVVGATPEQLRQQGFKPVGKDFPVFLHPHTHEEYALARTERKTAAGYHGFKVYASPEVTLEQDLQRRDLTINAMALDSTGRLIDPFGGQRDLEQRLLSHVSPAFAEDPVRILRLARFAARYDHLGFQVAAETQTLMQNMVANGEVDALVPERVWAETERALQELAPQRFFTVLRDCGVLARLFPELEQLFGVPQPAQHHPEIDSGLHTLACLQQAVRLGANTPTRFAVLCHDFGKGLTPVSQWPRHHGHERRGVPLVEALCQRLRVPRHYRELAVLVCAEHLHCHRALELRPVTVLKLLERIDAFRRPERLADILLACECDARGRAGREDQAYPQAEYLRQAHAAAGAVPARRFAEQGLRGPEIAAALHQARISAIRRVQRLMREA
jgi:tRNA nucleotidyltransferase (CCA-adding enzyme)